MKGNIEIYKDSLVNRQVARISLTAEEFEQLSPGDEIIIIAESSFDGLSIERCEVHVNKLKVTG